MVLIVDITKGFQPQTAECLLICEITCKKLIVVLNKIDLIPEAKRESTIEKMIKKVENLLAKTNILASPVIAVSGFTNLGLENLIETLKKTVEMPKRNTISKFLFLFDHCFLIKGSGAVFTGTVLQGSAKINDELEIASLRETKKVKSIQMFKKSVNSLEAGNRAGICLAQADSSKLERGILCAKNSVKSINCAVIRLNKIKYFKRPIKSKEKFHISAGHETVMATILVFSSDQENFNFDKEYLYEEQVVEDPENPKTYFAVVEFEKSVTIPDASLIIGSKFDEDLSLHNCRLAFYDTSLSYENASDDKNYRTSFLPRIKIFKRKQRSGNIQRVVNDEELIANLFKKETNREIFLNMKIRLSTGESGYIESLFGQSSKVKLRFPEKLQESTLEKLKKNKSGESVQVLLDYKKFVFNKSNEILQ